MASATTDLTEGGPLNQYLLLAKSAKGKACAAVISQALSAQSVYVFGELLEMPNVQQLEGTEDKKSLDLLKIFAYGTYADYKANAANYPPLSPAQAKKLKQLTIVTLSSHSKRIPYSVLQKELEIFELRELEDLIIDAIYHGIFQGTLDQRTQELEVEFAMGRDLKPDSIDTMISILQAWSNQSDTLMQTIREKVSHSNLMFESEKKNKEELAARIETLKVNLKSTMDEMGTEFEGAFYEGEKSRKGRSKKGRDHPHHPRRP